ncbi:MAG: hypothetical protein EON48_00390 [Acetobacteraceae bacterium]|nr:MAG: hypothetical protein EON48_00390 [Acetobacteraceae bacterium]
MAAATGLAAILAMAWPVAADPAVCRIGGWSGDPAGMPVRAVPSDTARALGHLPPFVRDDDGDYGSGFDILKARDGWLRIAGVTDAYRPSNRLPRRLFAGTGWVDGSSVRVAAQSGTGRAAPRADAPVIVSLGEEWLAGAGEVLAVTDCRGGWARLRYHLHAATRATGPRTGEAWFNGICPDQRTTCSATPPP